MDFSEVAECPFVPNILEKGFEDHKDVKVILLRRVFLWSGGEDGLSTFCYLSEYPTCLEAMGWDCERSGMNRAGLVQQFVKNGPVSHEGFVLPAHRLVVG